MNRANRLLVQSQSRAKSGAIDAKERTTATGILVLMPFIAFTLVLYFTVVVYHFLPQFTMYIVAFVFLCSIFMSAMPKKKYKQITGNLMVLAVIVAVLVAMYIYYNKLIYFFRYSDMVKYTNVAASQDPAAFADAGMLLFTSDSSVDSSRAVGFQYAEQHTTLCVAPIVDPSMGGASEISFFAVGQDCCAARAHFSCGGMSDASARSGLLVLDPGTISWPATGPLVEALSNFPREGFAEAVDLQKATFGTQVNDKMRFLWWTGEPLVLQEWYRTKGEHMAVSWVICYAVWSVLIGGFMGLYGLNEPNKKQDQADDEEQQDA